MEIREATTEADLDDVRRLQRAFLAWQLVRQGDDQERVTAYFEEAAWERELADLPGEYAAPAGALLVAVVEGAVVGCVAMKPSGPASCEMKRMYVAEAGRGAGVGRALAEAILARAREAGYAQMLLDTSTRQPEAIALYVSLGFEEIEPPPDLPSLMRGWLRFFRLRL